jgi:hypothetical protein
MKISQKKQNEYKQTLIALMNEKGYTVVTGKGSFKQGACTVLKDKKVVLNGFLPVDLQCKFLYDLLTDEDIEIPVDIAHFVDKIN